VLPGWEIFGFQISTFGIMVGIAFLVGGQMAALSFEKAGLTRDESWRVTVWCLVGGILGSKLWYAAEQVARGVPGDLFSHLLSRGGLTWYGGLVGGVIAAVLCIRIAKLPWLTVFNCAAPTLAMGQALGRIGCFLVGDDYGRPTASWVGITFPNGNPPTTVIEIESSFGVQVDPALVERFGQVIPVHPTQLYEVAMASLIFLVLWKLRVHEHGAGWLFWICLILLSLERFLVEFVRVKDDRFFGPLTLAQCIAITLALVGLWGVRRAWPAPPDELVGPQT